MSIDKEVQIPGWYLARDVKSMWWNLFVYITHEPPFQCIRMANNEEPYETLVSPEDIRQISKKKLSPEEFKVIQSLQKLR